MCDHKNKSCLDDAVEFFMNVLLEDDDFTEEQALKITSLLINVLQSVSKTIEDRVKHSEDKMIARELFTPKPKKYAKGK